ncbi:hypothetical protein R1sor_025686 [Riccia sorocarpa]|uniref:Uncharacterized protein n=1 Tax=Riccia sorocarpa TaxID=122646 RepID=A0ABD3G9B5_9MARC
MASRQPQVSGASKRMCSSRALALTLVFWVLLEFDNVDGHAHQLKLSANDLDFAERIEASVKSLAESVRSNYRGRKDLWQRGTCKTSCSIFACQTKQLDDKTHDGALCLDLPANSNLSSDQPCTPGEVKRCSKALLSNESYVL